MEFSLLTLILHLFSQFWNSMRLFCKFRDAVAGSSLQYACIICKYDHCCAKICWNVDSKDYILKQWFKYALLWYSMVHVKFTLLGWQRWWKSNAINCIRLESLLLSIFFGTTSLLFLVMILRLPSSRISQKSVDLKQPTTN